MILDPQSHARLEEFLREHLSEPDLKLPKITFHSGWLGHVITKAFKIGGITFGNHVFVAPRLLARGEDGRLTAPGKFVVHEALHVVQYMNEGYLRFFFKYLRSYFGSLRVIGRIDAAARMSAYLDIDKEREARAAANAYLSWLEMRRVEIKRGVCPGGEGQTPSGS